MNKPILLLFGLLALFVAGCGSNDANKPSTTQEVTEFKGNPTSPAVQQSLRAQFGGAPAPAARRGGPSN